MGVGDNGFMWCLNIPLLGLLQLEYHLHQDAPYRRQWIDATGEWWVQYKQWSIARAPYVREGEHEYREPQIEEAVKSDQYTQDS